MDLINEGLHSPDANINKALFGLKRIRIGGWLVVEDIVPDAIAVWKLVSALLPANCASQIFTAAGFMRERTGNFSIHNRAAALFAVLRLGQNARPIALDKLLPRSVAANP